MREKEKGEQKTMRLKKDLEKFLLALPELQPEEFLGVARLLKIKLVKDGEPKELSDLFEESIRRFEVLKSKERKTLLKLLEKIHQENLEEKKNVEGGRSSKTLISEVKNGTQN